MKLTKKLETEILKAYNTVWDSYLKGDMRTFASMLDENCYIIGSAAGEVFSNKKAAVKYYKATAEQITGKAEFRNRKIKVMPVEKGFMVNEEADFYLLIDDQWTFYGPARISSLFHKKKNKWKVVHQHGSFPDSKTEEGEQVNTDKIKAENIQLRDAVKRRTEELENKNRELEIEAALERVRARAMAMHNTNELAELVSTVFNELTQLDFRLTSCIIWIHDHESTKNTLWIASAEMNKSAKPFLVNAFHNDFFKSVSQAWKSKDTKWVYTFTGKEKKNFEKAFFKELPQLPIHLKNALKVPEQVVFSASFNNFGALEIVETEVLTDEKFEILHRFGKVFDSSYTRFNDLKKAEAQAREAQIETGLERVRSKTMAMHKSEEVTGIAVSLNEELLKLGFEGGSTIIIIDKETGDTEQWTGFSEDKTLQSCDVPYFKHPYHDALLNDWKRGEKFLVYTVTGKEKKPLDEHYFTTGYKDFPESDKKWMRQMKSVTFSHAFMKYGAIHWGPGHLTEEQLRILQRFSKVFEQSYTRFLDLQKAEAQAREAKIEAALERVRSRSMAMHKSDDLHEVIKVVTEQLSVLNLKFNVANFAKINQDGSWDLWLSTPEQTYPALIHVPYLNHPIFNRITEEEAKGNDFYTDVYTWEETNIFFHHFFENTIAKNSPEERKQFVYSSKGLARSVFQTKNIWFSVARYDITAFTDEENAIFKRFANVFEQAYTRFLDLQKAEAQARETEIELSLERVRAKTMAMQKPSEFGDVINIIGEQFVHLGFDIDWANFGANGFAISEGIDIWNFAVIPGASPISARVFIPYFDHPVFTISAANINEFLNGGRDLITVTLDKQTKDTWLDQLFTKTIFKDVPEEYRVIQYAKPGYTTSNISIKDTWLSIGKFDTKIFTDEQHAILRRFAKAFGQAYTRFLDLQKAEAQAREAQIEAGLERVRSRAMAMQSSEQLRELIGTVFTELTKLDIVLTRCLIMIYDTKSNDSVWWMANSEAPTQPIGLKVQYHEYPPYLAYVNAWKQKELKWTYTLEGNTKKEWDDFLFVETELSHLPDFVIAGMKAPDRVYLNASFNSFGNLTLATLEPLSDEHFDIMLRFAKVFDLTYTRFNDLKQAEAQTREAQIELALERVRARTMAMHQSDELAETAQVLFQQLCELGGIPDRIAIGIADEEEGVVNYWTTDQSGRHIDKRFKARLSERTVLSKTYKAWKDQKRSLVVDLHGDDVIEWVKFAREEMGVIVKDEFIKDRRVHSFAFFSHGWILVTTHEPQSAETIQILERFASVFNLTYRRFLDLQKAEAQAKEAQIEMALEKVRSRSLAMHKSDELQEVVDTVFERLQELNIEMASANIAIFKEGTRNYHYWIASPAQKRSASFYMPYTDLSLTRDLIAARESGKEFSTTAYSFEEKNEWFGYAFKSTDFKFLSEERKQFILNAPAITVAIAFSKNTGVQVNRYNSKLYTEGEGEILKRFSKVFEQAYIRFLDLEKAEAQARESQIEAVLERVRSSSLAMHKSEELKDVVKVVFENLRSLGLQNIDSVNINIFHEGSRDFDLWLAAPGQDYTTNFRLPYLDHPIANDFFNAVKKGETIHKGIYDYELKNKYFEYMFEFSDNKHLPEERKKLILNGRAYSVATGIAKHSSIFIHNYNGEAFSEEANGVLVRFSKVFDQAYTRFLDLQKAEAQAREAQIEATLERVRSRTMAMHKSDELLDIIIVVSEQLQQLNIKFGNVSFGVNNQNYDLQLWMAVKGYQEAYHIHWTFLDNPGVTRLKEAQQQPEKVYSDVLTQAENNEWLQHIFTCNPALDIFSDEARNKLLNSPGYARSIAVMKDIFIVMGNYAAIPYTDDENSILKRFANVFEQAYKRFLDLQKAEANSREAQIEAGLERVRAKAMAMHSSKDLAETLSVFYRELKSLSVVPIRCGVALMDKESRMAELTTMNTTGEGDSIEIIGKIKMAGHPVLDGVFESWLVQKEYHAVLRGNQIKEYYQVLKPQIDYLDYSHDEAQFGYYFMFNEGDVYAWTEKELTEDELTIYRRFTTVISLTYKRYKDLQQAEAQAKEAKIEAGLERVRARTMAMHTSEDVGAATATMFTELEKLGIQNLRGGITVIKAGDKQEVWGVTNLPDGRTIRSIGEFDMHLHPLWRELLKAKLNKGDYNYYRLAGKDKEDYIGILNATPNYLSQPIKDFPDVHVQSYFFGEGAIWTNSLEPHSDEQMQTMKRFASVFSLTFRRYQDLKKAEAQAKEAQIEAGLERVRSRTMAMHKSDELAETAVVLFKQMIGLGIEPNRLYIAIINDNSGDLEFWITDENGDKVSSRFIVNVNKNISIKKMHEGWVAKHKTITIDMQGKELEDWLTYWNEEFHVQFKPGAALKRRVQNIAYFSKGFIAIASPDDQPETTINLLERFAAVFNLTYTRFNDLQQAEAQAREATIEAALEKVRGKAMAMHDSNDLSVTASMIISELRKLGISPIRCGIGLLNKETNKAQLYTATSSADGDSLAVVGWVLLEGHPVLKNIYEKWLHSEDYFPELNGDSRKAYYEKLLAGLSVPLPDFKDDQKHYGHFFSISVGCLYAWADVKYNDDEIKILKRFASIIDLTFRRYFELQKSEANAREAVKQAALDRVRAEIASMRTINDLDRITPLIWNELTILGIPFIRCGVFIMDEEQQLIHTFLSTPDGKAIAAFHLPYDTPGNLAHVVANWKESKKYIDHWDESEFKQFAEILMKQGALVSAEQYLKTIPKGGFYLHFLPFLQGMLYVGNTDQLKGEEIELIQHVADAFSTAYARYEDFNKLEAAKQQVEKTLTDLKQAQTQLVQSEKMASLGEMTAGIAHEIQNPLNFVNNFSEVSKELLDEMKTELETGNTEDAKGIADDVIQNLEKINHHGKRADAIVKSMLQHSRSSSGKKEPTDINSLADEYLRLAYHGLRAKDKSFNAKFETAFDDSIGKINIISQDIGRVLVNLINNAFYAVSERKKQESNGYEPTVEVLTKKTDDKIEIKVKDNGNGIPQKVLDKIFQPFFTTKPTGQGTGLGLSLAYDIVTKGHNGELKVETKEGEGSEFIIQLPVSKTSEP